MALTPEILKEPTRGYKSAEESLQHMIKRALEAEMDEHLGL